MYGENMVGLDFPFQKGSRAPFNTKWTNGEFSPFRFWENKLYVLVFTFRCESDIIVLLTAESHIFEFSLSTVRQFVHVSMVKVSAVDDVHLHDTMNSVTFHCIPRTSPFQA